MMKKYVLVAVMLAFFFFGCIDTEVKHVQYADGSADITQETDLSGMTDLLSSSDYYDESLLGEETWDTVCDQYEGVKCEYEDGLMKLTKHFSPSEAFYKFEVKDDLFMTQYRLTIDELPSFDEYAKEDSSDSLFGDVYGDSYTSPYGSDYGGLGSEGPTSLSSPSSKATGAAIEQMGMSYTYTITMPGTIVSAEGATEFEGNTVEFDIAERLQEKEPIVVVSEEVNLLMSFMAGVMILVVVLAVAFVAIRALRPEQV